MADKDLLLEVFGYYKERGYITALADVILAARKESPSDLEAAMRAVRIAYAGSL